MLHPTPSGGNYKTWKERNLQVKDSTTLKKKKKLPDWMFCSIAMGNRCANSELMKLLFSKMLLKPRTSKMEGDDGRHSSCLYSAWLHQYFSTTSPAMLFSLIAYCLNPFPRHLVIQITWGRNHPENYFLRVVCKRDEVTWAIIGDRTRSKNQVLWILHLHIHSFYTQLPALSEYDKTIPQDKQDEIYWEVGWIFVYSVGFSTNHP